MTEGEDVRPTERDDIMVLKPRECMPVKMIDQHIKTLVNLALERDGPGIQRALCDAVPEYCPQVNRHGFEDGEVGVMIISEAKKMNLAN